jgi:hypothetical protein
MIRAIRAAAAISSRDDYDPDAYDDAHHPLGQLSSQLEHAFGEEMLTWAMGDMGWKITPKQSGAYEAGVWLNKLLNWWQTNQALLTYKGEQ